MSSVVYLTGASRQSSRVGRPLAELASDLYAACSSATTALSQAEYLHHAAPTRLSAIAVSASRRNCEALAEAHGLIRALIGEEAELRARHPDAFAAVPA